MAVVIFVAAWLAFRYRQSNYEPPESTVTVAPPPVVQPAPSGDVHAAVQAPPPPAPAPLPPVPQVQEQPTARIPDQFGEGEGIGGIGTFDTIAGETMFDFESSGEAPAHESMTNTPPPVVSTRGTETYMPPPSEDEVEMYSRSGYAEL